MTHATSTVTIHVPADAIWQVISDFGRPASTSPGSSTYG